ncbi:MAG: hypothetical protein LLG02_03765 [Pelosinus sp.]|nr:hypothetical protein [Pelosinus sp.]
MPLRPDFQSILAVFVYNNLPVLMNPANAAHVVITNNVIPTTATATGVPVLSIDPSLLQALQAASLNNFANLGLPPDIAQIAQQFFANLPPLNNPNAAVTVPITAPQTETTL